MEYAVNLMRPSSESEVWIEGSYLLTTAHGISLP